MGLVLFGFSVFPKVFTKPKKLSRKPKIQKKTKKTFGKPKKTKLLKVSDPPLDTGLVFCFFGFPEGFYKTKKTFDKTKNTKENQRKPKKPSGKPKNKVFEGFRPTLGYGFGVVGCLVFPKVFTKPKKPSIKPKIQKKTKENQRKPKTH